MQPSPTHDSLGHEIAPKINPLVAAYLKSSWHTINTSFDPPNAFIGVERLLDGELHGSWLEMFPIQPALSKTDVQILWPYRFYNEYFDASYGERRWKTIVPAIDLSKMEREFVFEHEGRTFHRELLGMH